MNDFDLIKSGKDLTSVTVYLSHEKSPFMRTKSGNIFFGTRMGHDFIVFFIVSERNNSLLSKLDR